MLSPILIIIICQGKLDLFQSDTQTYYKLGKTLISTVEMAATKQNLVLQIIGEVGSKGIW